MKRLALVVAMVAAMSATAVAEVPVDIKKGDFYAQLVDARANVHRCPSVQTRCRLLVPPGPALLQVVFDNGTKRERTFRLAPGLGVRLDISSKSRGALYATIGGAVATVLGYAILLPISLSDGFDGVLFASGLAVGSVGALTMLIAGPIYAASGPTLNAQPIAAKPAMGLKVGGRF